MWAQSNSLPDHLVDMRFFTSLICLLSLSFDLLCARPALAEKRVALVVGNSAYQHAGRLANPRNDATDVGAALKKLGGKRVGILVSTNPPQVALGDGLNAELKPKYGLEVVGYEKYGIKSTDYTPQLQALKDAGADIREGQACVHRGLPPSSCLNGEPAARSMRRNEHE